MKDFNLPTDALTDTVSIGDPNHAQMTEQTNRLLKAVAAAVPSTLADLDDGARLTISPTAPLNPSVGDVWINNSGATSGTPTTPAASGAVLDSTSGLVARYRANELSGASSSPVSSLAPRAGSSSAALTQSTAAAQPTVVVGAVNGRKALRFASASSQFMDAEIGQTTQPMTVFSVFNLKAANGTVYSSNDSNNYAFLKASSAGDALAASAKLSTDSSAAASSTTWTPTSGWRIVAIVYNGTNTRVYGHTRSATALSTGGGALPVLRVGRNASSTAVYADVDVAELAVVSGAMTDANVKAVLEDLAAYYGLTLGA